MNKTPVPGPPSPPLPPVFLSPLALQKESIPIGAVMAFAGAVAASGGGSACQTFLERSCWMLCDGRELSVEEYPELSASLGYIYGGEGGTFKIPDYRGYFLRGVSGSTQNDPDVIERKLPKGGSGGANNEAGSIQDDALQTHEHIYKSAPAPATPSKQGQAAGAPPSQPALTEKGPTSNLLCPPGDVKVSKKETRPKNVYVHFIIKCK